MAIAQRLELRQGQSLVMTPQLQQAIKLLQFSSQDLQAFVEAEMEINPFLDAPNESDGGDVADSAADAKQSDEGGERSSDDALEGRNVTNDDSGVMDADLNQNVFNNDSPSDGGPTTGSSGSGMGARMDALQNVENTVTLHDHLHEQLQMIPLTPDDRLIASHLIELVDDAGYILEGLNDAQETLGCGADDIERALGHLHGMDPAGVGARNLAECLALQLRERDRLDPCMVALLENLDTLAKHDRTALKRLCRVNDEDLSDMITEIQALNPKPGLSFAGGDPIQAVVPDVFVKKAPSGAWTVELNPDALPKVLVNNTYYAELASSACSDADKTFITEKFSNASWLVKALDQRARTILKVSTELVRHQDGFFTHGVRHLKPLTLRTIADAIEMHESTVSRVTSNKYIGTSRGIFEMKYFFTTAIASATGADAHSSESVRHTIKELIDAESPKAILSDDKIVALLRAEGMDIARRTVAKYREAMRIPSSVERRRQKRQG